MSRNVTLRIFFPSCLNNSLFLVPKRTLIVLDLFEKIPFSVADLGEGPEGPRSPLFWVKKKKSQKEEKPAGGATKKKKTPPPPLPPFLQHFAIISSFSHKIRGSPRSATASQPLTVSHYTIPNTIAGNSGLLAFKLE